MAEALRAIQPAPRIVALVGQPNVGKSAVFSALTGTYVTCSNYPGTTVELYRGISQVGDVTWTVLDTPGLVHLASPREDEGVTRELLLFGSVDAVIQVADSKNLERSLTLFAQLSELGLPLVLDLNMADERRARGIHYSTTRLARRLGVPVVETIGTLGVGLPALREALQGIQLPERPVGSFAFRDDPSSPRWQFHYGTEIEALLEPLQTLLAGTREAGGRALATLLLSLPLDASSKLIAELPISPRTGAEVRDHVARARAAEPSIGLRISLARERAAAAVAAEAATPPSPPPIPLHRRPLPTPSPWARSLGRWTVHPVWGVPILLAVLFLFYQFVGNLGAVVLVGWLEETLFGRYINPALISLADVAVAVPFLHAMLVGEYGLFTMALTYAVALILPIVTTFFLAFGVLEDSGYFPRLAVLSHRLFRKMGLSGQAVLPMVLGLSCDTMATVTTRVLETRKERVIATLLLALGVPCSAQLAVLLAMSAAVSRWVLVGVLGIVGLQLLIVGRLAAYLLPGQSSTFLAELPPLRWPNWRNIVAKTRLRLVWYLTEVLPLFVVGTLALFLLDQVGVLAAVERGVRPVVAGLLGLPPQTSAAFVMGFFRRDYGAAGLYGLQQAGALDGVQVLVSLVVITLFVPCIANLLVIVRERGWRTAVAIVAFVIPYSVLVGALVNAVARALLAAGFSAAWMW